MPALIRRAPSQLAVALLLGLLPALPLHATAPIQVLDTARKVKPAARTPPSAAKKAADTLATVGAAMAVDSLLGNRGQAIGQMLGTGQTNPCAPAGASPLAGLGLPGTATAGSKIVGLAKQSVSKDSTESDPAPAAPCPNAMAGGGMGSAIMMATPMGMAVTAAPLAAAGLGAAAKGVKKILGGGPMTPTAMLKQVEEKGHLALRGVRFVASTDVLEDGYEAPLTTLAEALTQVPGPFALHVEPEAAKGEEPDAALAHKRIAKIWATLVSAGVPETVFVAGVVAPESLVRDRKPVKPGSADVEVWKVSGGARAVPVAVVAAAAESAAVRSSRAALWLNYDFVPGNRVLFVADYRDDQVGNFPKRLTFRSGKMEVVELDGGRWVRVTGSSRLTIPLPEILPAKFTIEIDVINRQVLDGAAFRLQGGLVWSATGKVSTVEWGSDGVGVTGGEGTVPLENNVANTARYRGKPSQLRILGDGKYIKVYLDEKRYANIPNASFERSRALTLVAEGRGDENPVYIGAIRVAAGDRAIYDVLAATGRVATQGILFDSGSDRIRPESGPTLKEIAAMLEAHPDLRLAVEGHTDDVGAAPANLALSEARARAVAAVLVGEYGVAATRLEARGLGGTRPVGKNDTAEGRQNNRRVELVKI